MRQPNSGRIGRSPQAVPRMIRIACSTSRSWVTSATRPVASVPSGYAQPAPMKSISSVRCTSAPPLEETLIPNGGTRQQVWHHGSSVDLDHGGGDGAHGAALDLRAGAALELRGRAAQGQRGAGLDGHGAAAAVHTDAVGGLERDRAALELHRGAGGVDRDA